MNISVSLDTKHLNKMLDKAVRTTPHIVAGALSKATANASELLVDRTSKGYGVDGALRPYSARYAAMKRAGWKSTRSRRGFGGDSSGVVNLTVHNDMLGSIAPFKAKISGKRIWSVIAPDRASEKLKVFHTNNQRYWWGFSSRERSKISSEFRRFFVADFKRAVK